jgi:hypothetical protein
MTPVFIASTMRSGSTLLKALLAVAEDVSDIPEFNFQSLSEHDGMERVQTLSDKPIVVMKRPAWFHEAATYPRLPQLPNRKTILLVRDVYETVVSLRKMVFRKAAPLTGSIGNRFLVHHYWSGVMKRLLIQRDMPDCMMIRYEDLVANPVDQTAKLFQFIGSSRTAGTDTYNPPGYDWKWGRDDGGQVIQSLKVRPPKPAQYRDAALVQCIQTDSEVLGLRERLGYGTLPTAE